MLSEFDSPFGGWRRIASGVDQPVDRQRSAGGVAVFGLECTRHDDRTMRELSTLVDAVVWVESTADGPRLDFQRTSTR